MQTNTYLGNVVEKLEIAERYAQEYPMYNENVEILREIQKCVTTNAVLDILYENGLLDNTMEILNGRIQHNIDRRIPSDINIGFICFTNTGEYSGVLFESENVNELKELWKK